MHDFFATSHVVLEVSGLMIECIDPFDDGDDLLAVLRIRTVGIALGRDMLKRTVFVHNALGLFEQEPAGRHTVLERNRLDRHVTVLKDDLVLTRVDGMEDDVVQAVGTMVVQ